MTLQTLDLIIGLATVFLTVSLVCSSLNELLAAMLNLRAATLRQALDYLLGSKLADDIVNHAVIPAAVVKDGKKQPAYIEPQLFATALLSKVTTGQSTSLTSDKFALASSAITAGANGLQASPAHEPVKALAQMATSYEDLKNGVAGWFNAYMDRVSGVYKRRSHLAATLIAVAVVAILNIDTIAAYRSLTMQPAFQSVVAHRANVLLHSPASASSDNESAISAAANNLSKNIAMLPTPIGWHLVNGAPADAPNWFQKVIGLLITIVAASFGAPFWFGVLTRLTNIRSAGPKPGDRNS